MGRLCRSLALGTLEVQLATWAVELLLQMGVQGSSIGWGDRVAMRSVKGRVGSVLRWQVTGERALVTGVRSTGWRGGLTSQRTMQWPFCLMWRSSWLVCMCSEIVCSACSNVIVRMRLCLDEDPFNSTLSSQ